jgi:TP901 family phage tail tape measure protein
MATLAELIVKVGGDATQFEKHMSKVEKRLGKIGSQLQSIGTKLTIGLTAPLAAVGGASLKTAIDFESAFAGVRKTVDATEDQFAALEKGIRDMAKEIPQSATDIAAIAEAAGQLGIETESILGFTRVMADLGVTTNLSGDEAATALARLANITQMPQSQFDRLGSTIVALGNSLATTEAEIVEMGLRIAGAGHQVGMTEAQILGVAAALSSVGISADAGGSAISKVMINIASQVASGGEKLQGFAEVAGMSATQFQAAWRDNAASALAAFIEGLGRMQAEGQNVFGVLDELGLSEIRVRDALLRAAGAGDLFGDSLRLGSEAWMENSALTNEAAQRYETTESKLTALKNKVVDAGISLGEALVPALSKAIEAAQPLIDGVARLAEKFANLDPEMQQTIVTIAAVVAGIGPLLVGVGTAINTFSGLAGAASKLGGMLQWLTTPTGLVVAAIAAAIAIGVELYKNWDTIKEKLTGIWNSINETAEKVWNGVLTAIKTPINAIISALNVLIRGLNRISFKVPDWVPILGGKSWGFNIPEIPMLARGGIVMKPTLAMLGEAGPEAVVPLDRAGGLGTGPVIIIVELEGRRIAQATAPHLTDLIRLKTGVAY